MRKNDILTILSQSTSPICDDCIALNQEFKRTLVNKYCSELEKNLYVSRTAKQKCSRCFKQKKLNIISVKGIDYLSQLAKKDILSEVIELELSGEFNFNFKFEWVPLTDEDGNPHSFPNTISKAKQNEFNKPAVYRWSMINKQKERTKNIYIGEATDLANRIYQYVNPGIDQQTNIRLNTLFHANILNKYDIVIDQLKFNPFKIGNHTIDVNSLTNKYVRKLLEHLMASYYLLEGYKVLNA